MTYWSKVTFLTDDPLKQNGWWQIFQSIPTEDYRKPIGSTEARDGKVQASQEGKLQTISYSDTSPKSIAAIKGSVILRRVNMKLELCMEKLYKNCTKRTSKEENTKNHCSNPQCRKNLCNSFIRDWNVSEKNGKIKTETTFYFHILFVKSCKARFYCCPGSSIPTLGHWLGLSLPLQNLKTERKQGWILPHTSTIDHWQYSKIMNLKLSQWFWGTSSFEYCFCLFVISVEEAVMAVKCQRACKGPPSQPVPFSCSGTM